MPANGNGAIDPDRRWYLVRGVPVALIVTLTIAFASQTGVAVWYFAQQNAKQEQQGVRLGSVESKLDDLIKTVQSGTVPSALNAARIAALENQVASLQALIAQVSTRAIDNDRRVTAIEARAAASELRNRAARER